MPILAELTRPFWLSGIHAVSGRQSRGLAAWISDEKFQVYVQIARDSATLTVQEIEPIALAFAADCTRMVSAALESAVDVEPSTRLPRSKAWLVIRTYYAAFFAAHGILRMLGISLTKLEAPHAKAVSDIADLYQNANGTTLTKGLYVCRCDAAAKTLSLTKADTSDGSHVAMWRLFYQTLSAIEQSLLAGNAPSGPALQVAAKITEACSALSYGSAGSKGSWLSEVRNRINYRHDFGVWYPYADRPEYYDRLHDSFGKWRTDPMQITVWPQPGRDLQRFAEVCALIVAICREMSEEMSLRCPKGASFHRTGGLAILNLV